MFAISFANIPCGAIRLRLLSPYLLRLTALQTRLSAIAELTVENANTNMLYFSVATQEIGAQLGRYLKSKDILISAGKRTRLVTHLDISAEDIDVLVEEVKRFFLL